ncbi:putative ABC transporter permease subunit [Mechercharimyces sp. CAU 1602]|uniref:putative ABC transporter permease subunit n=1 Tax=Mechercharimyces sp. CAU 1602 TaxID=2973933 RepID=UPI00216291A5|nr:ABC transporter permease [Mechercharimyces sp. CAU 1602]MCS1352061.1 ABC transporter permease [Mechercharimyces sp. CAU 1602]
MSTFIPLLKHTLRNQYPLRYIKYRLFTKKNFTAEALSGISIIFFILMSQLFIIPLSLTLYTWLAAINQEEAMLSGIVVLHQITTFCLALLFVYNSLYHNKNHDSYLSMPVSPLQVLGVKFVGMWLHEITSLLPFFLPPLLIYGILSDSGWSYFITMGIVYLLLPLFPLALAASIIMFLMRIIPFQRIGTWAAVLTPILAMGVYLAFFQHSPNTNGIGASSIGQWLTNEHHLVTLLGEWFPPSLWAATALSNPSLAALPAWGGWILFQISSVFLYLKLGHFFYIPSLRRNHESSPQPRKPKAEKQTHQSMLSPTFSLFWREWKMYYRTPVFLVNTLLMPFMLFAFMVLPQLRKPTDLPQAPSEWEWATWIITVIMVYLTSVNGASYSAVSREGPFFTFTRSLPISGKEWIQAKWLHLMILNSSFITITLLVITLFLGASPVDIVWIWLLSLLSGALSTHLGIFIDLSSPKLDWINPKDATNKNFNGLTMMILTTIILIVFGSLVGLLYWLLLPAWVVKSTSILLLIAINYGFWRGLLQQAERAFTRIER